MATNILGIGIANAIGFRRYLRSKNSGGGSVSYPGLIAAWSAKGKTNDDEDRAILKDLTGNGHDITLKGFTFSGMSGYGGYKTNMLNWKYNNNSAIILSSANKFITYNTRKITTHFWDYVSEPPLGTIHRPSFKLKISGLNEDEAIYYTYWDGEDFSVPHEGNLYNGINIFPEINAEIVTEKLPYTTVFEIHSQVILDKEITFEILPEYPDALVFDGVDDYGVNHSVPSLSDYTIIVKKKALNNYGVVCATIGNFGKVAFVISDKFNRDNGMVYANSFSWETLVKWVDNISYQTKNSYNGKTISVGKIITTHGFGISMYGGQYWKGAFYSAYLFNRSLDEQEIKTFIRKYIDPEYFLPSEIPTPDCYYDFSQGSNDDETRDTIKDYSGNGNDAVAHNFAWSGMSGYSTNFLNWSKEIATEVTHNKIIMRNISSFANWINNKNQQLPNGLKINVFGIIDETVNYRYSIEEGGVDNNILKLTNGINILPPCYACNFYSMTIKEECNIVIELIPEYPGALVLDGIDDYVSLDAFNSGFKTVFMKFKPINTINAGYYDQIKKGQNSYYFSISGTSSDIAFTYRNTNGKTYINGIPNTSILAKDVVNKTVCIGIVNENVREDNTTIPKIGDGTHFTPWFANMILYKFLGFKEALTEEQINAIIKKYNLLDGVDEIEVN